MNISVAVRSVAGRIRKNNEDNFCVNASCLPLNHSDIPVLCNTLSGSRRHLLGVLDGMGGYNAGEEASFLAATVAGKFYLRVAAGEDSRTLLEELCMEANKAVCEAAKGCRMGTTCAFLHLTDSRYTICNVGDSPIFLFRNGMLSQISEDHNGKSTYEAATGQPAPPGKKFALTQCIGIPEDEMMIEPFIAGGDLEPGDVFLLCSDGVTDMVTPERIREMISSCEQPRGMIESLVEAAMEAGGRDNITAICARIEME